MIQFLALCNLYSREGENRVEEIVKIVAGVINFPIPFNKLKKRFSTTKFNNK
jgi:hypothetical protein